MLENGSGLTAQPQKMAFRFTYFSLPLFCSSVAESHVSNAACSCLDAVATDADYLCLLLQIMIGVQHFAHFYLTLLLLDKMKESAPPPGGIRSPTRIVFTTSASEATAQQEIPWDNLG